MNQQEETLKYYNRDAKSMKERANKKNEGNVIRQRNSAVLDAISKRKETKSALDIGCGTGNLVRDIARQGIKAIGVDFSKEMIDICKNNAKGLKNVEFVCQSIFDFEFDKYDVISANGFIEYISYEELSRLLDLCWKGLNEGGSFLLGSRNRLFNVFSLNKYTEEEEDIELLIKEAIDIQTIDVKNITTTLPLQEEDKKECVNTANVAVSTRYQFTPAQLADMLRPKFEPVDVYPINIHGVLPSFKSKYPSIQYDIANLLEKYKDNSLIPQAASFVINFKKI